RFRATQPLLSCIVVVALHKLGYKRDKEETGKSFFKMLSVFLIWSTLFREVALVSAAKCKMAVEAAKAVTAAHNRLRANIATRKLDKTTFGNLPGSKSLFKLEYECTHEVLASQVIGQQCKYLPLSKKLSAKGHNFITYRRNKEPDSAMLIEMFGLAVHDWSDTVHEGGPLSSSVVYSSDSMEPFANMIYNRTLHFGCAYRFCKAKKKVAIACAYEKKRGCFKNKSCKKIFKNAVCAVDNGEIGPLCELHSTSLTASPTKISSALPNETAVAPKKRVSLAEINETSTVLSTTAENASSTYLSWFCVAQLLLLSGLTKIISAI
ncbi:unnamed protein product, partial [Cylicocyclus nassatus]